MVAHCLFVLFCVQVTDTRTHLLASDLRGACLTSTVLKGGSKTRAVSTSMQEVAEEDADCNNGTMEG